MKKIRTKLSIISFISLVICFLCAYWGYRSYKGLESINAQLMQATDIEANLRLATDLPFYRSINKNLTAYKGQLEPEYRDKLMKKIISAHNRKSRGRLKTAIKNFRKQEKRRTSYLKDNKSVYESRILSLAYVMGLSYLLTILFISLYTYSSVFRPLKSLSKRMIDFLDNRYTYQFRVPKENEVGELELNFHSLAQRVLNNIEELKSLDSAKSDFLNMASHELRTPLTSIKGSLILLQNGVIGEVNEKSKQLLGIAEVETDRLIRLINELLDLAKIEAGKFPLQQDWCSLDEVITNTLFSLEGLAATADVKLSYENKNKLVEIDKDRIQQVITNLMSNAIKYSPQKGTVRVAASLDNNNHILIEIIDQGKGISPEDQSLIFEKFRQASGPQNPIVKGTGLGLAIARAIVEEHGGEIGVHSRVGEGSTFHFTLPTWKEDTSAPDEEQNDDEGVAA